MAKLYGEIAKSALLTLDKSFSRALGQPLDASEVYYSLEAAQTYAATPAAYVGQKIVVIENGKVTHYSVEDAAGTLKEVGVKPIGDNKSITVSEAGIVSILGADTADSLTLPRMKEDKSGVEWVPVSQVVQGDGNDNTTYEITALTKVTGEGEAQVTETYGIHVKTLFNGTAVQDGEFDVEFDVYTKSEIDNKFNDINEAITNAVGDLEEAIADAKEEAIAAIPTNVSAFTNDAGYLTAHQDISGKADKATTLAGYGIADAYTKTEVEGKIDNAVKGILGEDVAEAYDTLKEIQDILAGVEGDKIDGLIEVAADNKAKLETLNGDVNTVGSVDAKIAAAVEPLATSSELEEVRELADAAQTADEVSAAIEAAFTAKDLPNTYAGKAATEEALGLKANAADVVANTTFEDFKTANTQAIADAVSDYNAVVAETYATKAEIIDLETEIAETYAEKATTLEGYGIDDAYTKSEVYTKGEVDTAITNKIKDFTGGESAKDVLLELRDYKKANDSEIYGADVVAEWTDAEGVYAPVYSAKDSRLDKVIAKANDNAILAQQGVDDAAAAQSAAEAAQATANEAKAQADTNKTAIGGHAARILALENADIAHAAEYSALNEIVSGHTTALAGKAAQADLDKAVADIAKNSSAITSLKDVTILGITQELAKKANSADVYTKTEVNNLITASEYDDTNIKALITAEAARADAAEKANAQAILDEAARADAAEKVNAKAIADEITRAKAAEKENADEIARVNAVLVAAIENEDDTALNSIKELAIWVEEHESEVLPAIENNTKAIAAIYTPASGEGDDAVAASGVLVTEIARVEEKIDTNARDIAAINNSETGIAAVAKKYTDDTMIKADEASIENKNGTFSVKKVSVDILDDTGIELILNAGDSGYKAPEVSE